MPCSPGTTAAYCRYASGPSIGPAPTMLQTLHCPRPASDRLVYAPMPQDTLTAHDGQFCHRLIVYHCRGVLITSCLRHRPLYPHLHCPALHQPSHSSALGIPSNGHIRQVFRRVGSAVVQLPEIGGWRLCSGAVVGRRGEHWSACDCIAKSRTS